MQGRQSLHSTLSSHSKKFVGILNSIDIDACNPTVDTFLEVQHNAYDLEIDAAKGDKEEDSRITRHNDKFLDTETTNNALQQNKSMSVML